MSQPFRIRVPSSTTTQSRRGRSLAEVDEANKRERKNRYDSRGGGRGGRGGRGRGYGRGRFNRRQQKEKTKKVVIPRLKPGEPGYFPVGGTKWAELKKQANPPQAFYSNILDDMTTEEKAAYSKSLPRLSGKPQPRKNAMSPTEAAESRGWEHHADPFHDENGNIIRYDSYWTHPKYAPTTALGGNPLDEEPRFQSGYVNWFGDRYEIPIENENDTQGLAYRYEISPVGNQKIVPNYWESFWDTRRGKRYSNYLDYLEYREKKRDEYQESGLKRTQQVYAN